MAVRPYILRYYPQRVPENKYSMMGNVTTLIPLPRLVCGLDTLNTNKVSAFTSLTSYDTR